MKPLKATREQLKRHNRQLILWAVFTGLADNRAALALATGLAKPTVSDLVGELLIEGLLVEGGHGVSTDSGGKRPRLLEFVPHARQVIGVSVAHDHVLAILSNLDGQIVARHHTNFSGTQEEGAIEVVKSTINGLIAQLDSPLLCIGIGVPGVVDTNTGIIRRSYPLNWHNLALSSVLQAQYHVPVYTGNQTELAVRGQFTFGSKKETRNLVMLSINDDVEIGIALGGYIYHHGGKMSCLRLSNGMLLQSVLRYEQLVRRITESKQDNADTPSTEATYLHVRHGAENGEVVCLQAYNEWAEYLAEIYMWILGIVRPDEIALAGPLTDLGERLLKLISTRIIQRFDLGTDRTIQLTFAESPHLTAIGAVALALQYELGIYNE